MYLDNTVRCFLLSKYLFYSFIFTSKRYCLNLLLDEGPSIDLIFLIIYNI